MKQFTESGKRPFSAHLVPSPLWPDSEIRETVLRPSALLGRKGPMDHAEAMRLQAAVKHVLGELRQAERDSFEERYFECGECALDVHAAPFCS